MKFNQRQIAILKAISVHQPTSFDEVARLTGFTKSSVQHWAGRLETDGYTEYDYNGWRRKPRTLRLSTLGTRYMHTYEIVHRLNELKQAGGTLDNVG